MKYLKTTFLGAITILIILLICEYIGSLFASYTNKMPTTFEQILGGLFILTIAICVICLSYMIGKLIQLFIKF